jgi:hypothetical protein
MLAKAEVAIPRQSVEPTSSWHFQRNPILYKTFVPFVIFVVASGRPEKMCRPTRVLPSDSAPADNIREATHRAAGTLCSA